MVMVVRGVGKWARESRAHVLFTVFQVDQIGFGVLVCVRWAYLYVNVCDQCIYVNVERTYTTESSICAQARAILATKTKEQKQNHVSNLKMVYDIYAFYDLNSKVLINFAGIGYVKER